jgi:tetratricopeptide (TPR) repeat protein
VAKAGGGAGRAQSLRRAGRNEEAATAYRRYLKKSPGDADAWRGLGLCYIPLQRLDDAAYCFWQALKYRPASLRLIMQLGDILVQTGDMERAATVFEHMIKAHPTEARGFLSLSAVQRELGQVELAGATLRNGVGKSPISVLSSLRASEACILRLRGVQNTYYSVAPEGSHWLRLRGGNFSSSALWDQDRFTTINFLIADENILEFDPIPSHQVVVNSIADADLESRSLRAAAKYLANNPTIPVINNPLQVLNTTRDNNYQRLNGTPGVRFPKTLRLDWRPEIPFDAVEYLSREGLALPVVLRRTGTHTAVSTIKADTISEVERYFAAASPGEYYVREYVRHPFRDDYFRKMRVFFIDGEIYPVVHHVDTVWNVHGFNRTTVMAATPWM